MKIIGLTGTSGSGKGYVSKILSKYNIASVDTDKIVHTLYSDNAECKNELRENFGESVMLPDGNVDRKELAKIVFSDKNKLLLLNATVHKYVIKICDEMARDAEKRGEKAFVIDAPQLFEASMQEKCDFVVAVIADKDVRRARLEKRDNLSREDIEKRLANQHSDSFFHEKADYVIINNGNNDTVSQIEKILSEEELL